MTFDAKMIFLERLGMAIIQICVHLRITNVILLGLQFCMIRLDLCSFVYY